MLAPASRQARVTAGLVGFHRDQDVGRAQATNDREQLAVLASLIHPGGVGEGRFSTDVDGIAKASASVPSSHSARKVPARAGRGHHRRRC